MKPAHIRKSILNLNTTSFWIPQPEGFFPTYSANFLIAKSDHVELKELSVFSHYLRFSAEVNCLLILEISRSWRDFDVLGKKAEHWFKWCLPVEWTRKDWNFRWAGRAHQEYWSICDISRFWWLVYDSIIKDSRRIESIYVSFYKFRKRGNRNHTF